MKTPNVVKQNVKEKERHIAKEKKVTICCIPTCCSGSNDKTNIGRKEK